MTAQETTIDNKEVNNTKQPVMPLMAVIKPLLKKWWVFAIVGLVAGIGGVLYATYQKPLYESRLTFSLDGGSNDGALSSAMNLAAQFGLGVGSGQSMFDGDNILEIMKSRRMLEKVLLSVDTFENKQYTLIEYYLEQSDLKEAFSKSSYFKNVSFPVGIKREQLSYLQDSILYNVYLGFSKENLSASRPDKKLSIYEVRVVTANEKLSKIFTDKIVKETDDFYTGITSKKDKETLEILEQRVASLKGNVGTSIDVRSSSQDANVNPAFAAAQSPLLKEQYNIQAYGEAYKEMFKTLEMARYQYLKRIPLLQIIDHADYPMKRIKAGRFSTGLLFSVFSVLIVLLLFLTIRLFRPDKGLK
jgi:hypothetical protein